MPPHTELSNVKQKRTSEAVSRTVPPSAQLRSSKHSGAGSIAFEPEVEAGSPAKTEFDIDRYLAPAVSAASTPTTGGAFAEV